MTEFSPQYILEEDTPDYVTISNNGQPATIPTLGNEQIIDEIRTSLPKSEKLLAMAKERTKPQIGSTGISSEPNVELTPFMQLFSPRPTMKEAMTDIVHEQDVQAALERQRKPEISDQEYAQQLTGELPIAKPAALDVPQETPDIPKLGAQAQSLNKQEDILGQIARDQAAAQRELATAKQTLDAGIEQTKKYYSDQRASLDEKQSRLEREYIEGKIDPNHFWGKQTGFKGGMNRVLSMIGLFLGGNAQIRTGVNPAQAMLDKAIQADIDAQKTNLGKTKSLLDLNMLKYGDLRAAEAATKADYLTAFSAQLQKVASQTSSQQILSQIKFQQEQIKLKREELNDTTAKASTQKAISAYLLNPDLTPAQVAAAAVLDPEKAAQYVPGVGFVLNKAETTKVADMKSTYDTMIGSLREMKALRNAKGAEFLNRNAVNTGKSLQTQLTLDAKTLFGLGVLSISDLDLIDKLVPDPTSVGFVDSKLDAAEKFLTQKTQNFLKNRVANFQGLSTRAAFTPDGS